MSHSVPDPKTVPVNQSTARSGRARNGFGDAAPIVDTNPLAIADRTRRIVSIMSNRGQIEAAGDMPDAAEVIATATLLDRDRLQSVGGIVGNLSCILGGRAAEMIVFGEALAGSGGGAQSDLAQATRIALELETALGLGGDTPLVYRMPSNPSEVLLYNAGLADRVQERLEHAERQAVELLEPHRDLISALGKRLVQTHALEGETIRETLSGAVG